MDTQLTNVNPGTRSFQPQVPLSAPICSMFVLTATLRGAAAAPSMSQQPERHQIHTSKCESPFSYKYRVVCTEASRQPVVFSFPLEGLDKGLIPMLEPKKMCSLERLLTSSIKARKRTTIQIQNLQVQHFEHIHTDRETGGQLVATVKKKKRKLHPRSQMCPLMQQNPPTPFRLENFRTRTEAKKQNRSVYSTSITATG